MRHFFFGNVCIGFYKRWEFGWQYDPFFWRLSVGPVTISHMK